MESYEVIKHYLHTELCAKAYEPPRRTPAPNPIGVLALAIPNDIPASPPMANPSAVGLVPHC